VLRRILLAALFCALAWTTSALATPQMADGLVPVASGDVRVVMTSVAGTDTTATGPALDTDSGGSDHDRTSDGQWNAAPRASAAMTESVWRLPLVHAELASARGFDLFAAIRAASPPDFSARPAPVRPLRIPLLI
jgi:hypothetical protein